MMLDLASLRVSATRLHWLLSAHGMPRCQRALGVLCAGESVHVPHSDAWPTK